MDPHITDAAPTDGERLQSLRQLTLVTYVLYAVGLCTGLFAFVAIIINHVKRDETEGTIYRSHFSWQIRTFWWGLAWSVLGFLTAIVGVGFVILAASWLWILYRLVRGFLNWNDGKPMPV